jgi:predicted DNA-binding WGR domain protein
MARFYALSVQPTLFGEWTVVREWGRIGSPGQVRTSLFPTAEMADGAMQKTLRHKERRGYVTYKV